MESQLSRKDIKIRSSFVIRKHEYHHTEIIRLKEVDQAAMIAENV